MKRLVDSHPSSATRGSACVVAWIDAIRPATGARSVLVLLAQPVGGAPH